MDIKKGVLKIEGTQLFKLGSKKDWREKSNGVRKKEPNVLDQNKRKA